jgi:hypothetical protein
VLGRRPFSAPAHTFQLEYDLFIANFEGLLDDAVLETVSALAKLTMTPPQASPSSSQLGHRLIGMPIKDHVLLVHGSGQVGEEPVLAQEAAG